MRRSVRNVRVGFFVAAAMIVLITALSVVGGIKLWKSSRVYHIRFEESVAGLDKGSPVRLKGVRVGTVDGLRIPPDDITKVEVTISVSRGTPMKTDTEATIASVGITGLRYIELTSGTLEASDLPSGSTIIGTESFLSAMTGTAETAVLKAEILMDNLLAITNDENRQTIERVLKDLSKAIGENAGDVSATISEFKELVTSLREMSDELQAALEENREDMRTTLDDMSAVSSDARAFFEYLGREKTIERMDTMFREGSELAQKLNALVGDNQYALDQTLMDLQESTRNLNEFTRTIRAKPSLLLHGAAVRPRSVDHK
jgi:phospholipid/cholesterol/gamma-HCH transport system substrate-binding protein